MYSPCLSWSMYRAPPPPKSSRLKQEAQIDDDIDDMLDDDVGNVTKDSIMDSSEDEEEDEVDNIL